MLEPNCSDESSGLLPVGVPANVPTQLDEFDSDEFDSDKEFRRPYIPDIVIEPLKITKQKKLHFNDNLASFNLLLYK